MELLTAMVFSAGTGLMMYPEFAAPVIHGWPALPQFGKVRPQMSLASFHAHHVQLELLEQGGLQG